MDFAITIGHYASKRDTRPSYRTVTVCVDNVNDAYDEATHYIRTGDWLHSIQRLDTPTAEEN